MPGQVRMRRSVLEWMCASAIYYGNEASDEDAGSTRICPRRCGRDRRGAGVRRSALAQAAAQGWEEAVKKMLGDAKATDGKLTMDLPEIAENGNTVPFTITSTVR